MFDYDELFDMRCNIGAKLEALMKAKGYTKAHLSKEVGISRPTLDKMLNGLITSQVNFKRHLRKILDHFHMTPDELMGSSNHLVRNQIRAARQALRTKAEDIIAATGISAERLSAIERGEEASLAEIRDIAACLSTGTHALYEETIFEDQLSTLDDLVSENDHHFSKGCGFWGHVGIQPTSSDEHFWYPITRNTCDRLYREMQSSKRIVIPCMNNKLLYVNLANIKQILLLDEACDEPGFTNWAPSVSCGEIPMVVYEALDDYFEYTKEELIEQEAMSERFYAFIQHIVEKEEWTEDTLWNFQKISLHYRDGKVLESSIDFDRSDSIVTEVEFQYNFGSDHHCEDTMLSYESWDGAIVFFNPDEIAFIELPCLETEQAIIDSYEDD